MMLFTGFAIPAAHADDTTVTVPVKITVLDESDKPLAGAKVKVVDTKDGKVVKEWTSTTSAEGLNLAPGTYKLTQTAPNGYKVKEAEKTFTVASPISSSESATFTKVYAGEGVRGAHILGDLTGKDNGTHTVVYCFNKTRKFPVNGSTYTRVKGDENNFENLAAPGHSNDLYNNVARVIWNGYPNDASGIMKKYNLTPDTFAGITQWAVWHYTDPKEEQYVDLDEVTNESEPDEKAYKELIESTTPAPQNMILDIYKSDSSNYQNAVTSHFYTAENMSLTISDEKTETPETPTPETPKPNKPTTPSTPTQPKSEQPKPQTPTKPVNNKVVKENKPVTKLATTGTDITVIAAVMMLLALAGTGLAVTVKRNK
ncbi:thioester-forming surface-anchored protein [Alloscardovia venturai]